MTYYIGDKVYRPQPNDIMLFPFGGKSKTVVDHTEPYERMVMKFTPRYTDSPYKMFPSFESVGFGITSQLKPENFKTDSWLTALEKIKECKEDYSPEITSNLSVFFTELCKAVQGISKISDSELYSKITDYINSDLNADLSLDSIADNFFISRSKLTSLFRKMEDTTVWEYVTAKRLDLAEKLILEGTRPTTVYSLCGFHDYTAFFKAYKNRFGISPKETKR